MPTGIAVNVKWDDANLLLRMRNGERKLTFAIVNALNYTALKIQEAEQERVLEEFHPRTAYTRRFLTREAAYIGKADRASVQAGRAYADVSVGQKARLLLSGFESGAKRPPFVGKRAAMPVIGGARPTERGAIPPKFRFTNLSMHQVSTGAKGTRKRKSLDFVRHVTSTGKLQWKGAQRTFILPKTEGLPHGGVFQRISSGKGGIRLLYAFRQWPDLKRRLKFIATAKRIAQANFAAEMERQVKDALAHEAGR